MSDEKIFLTIGENNDGEFNIAFDYSVIESEQDALLIIGILDRIKTRLHNMLDDFEYDEDEDMDDEEEEDELY